MQKTDQKETHIKDKSVEDERDVEEEETEEREGIYGGRRGFEYKGRRKNRGDSAAQVAGLPPWEH